MQAAETAAANTHSSPTNEDTMDKGTDDAQATDVQPFRLLELPDELWVRIGKMVVDDSPGIATPPEKTLDMLIPRSSSGTRRRPFLQLSPEAEAMSAADYKKYMMKTYFPAPPAISRTNSRLRRELLVYYYKTRIDLTFDWRDLLGSFVYAYWVRKVDREMRRVMQGVKIIGLRDSPAALTTLPLGPDFDEDEYVHVAMLKAELKTRLPDIKEPTWTDLVRTRLRVEFEVEEQTEYDALRDIKEYKGKLVFK
ncbi:hypothetical protein TI39_contig341g00007 [Zymoseptoria brevis]|uniref:Uncharacterized protein n=1 Tax=Zymoseptoria brevis TaxID=1047168 RepID=A0A0F4GVA3_9PEZI|nr:hypothetical protein TI39_contig341g00007 [Zymoseptoria brevis]